MQPDNEQESRFGLVRDMFATIDVIRRFDPEVVTDLLPGVRATGRLLLTGEGSSRIFPAGNAVARAHQQGDSLAVFTEASGQAADYDLRTTAVFGVSNSGRTAEVIRLFQQLKNEGHDHRFSLTAHSGSTLETLATKALTLSCGPEAAVAATKSVVEQALVHRALIEAAGGRRLERQRLDELAGHVQQALSVEIPEPLVEKIAGAGTIYWAGRNDGVAEELTLKTNEIARKPSDFLEGTYAVHGVEEVMNADDVVLWIDPPVDSEQKFADVLAKGVGLCVIAIASRPTVFPTLRIPDAADLNGFVQMAAGWNVLVAVGLRLGIDLDKPQRARKVGNEFTG